ncbi:hypothetical protein [Photobacterium leiognathi]|uniref:hypothetical protein n=1 Tax=Photobacterium leiognathi TaxID=553611 RepID=UPI00298117AA|nr:hypothetical protein [Photobacterium leiognathi]
MKKWIQERNHKQARVTAAILAIGLIIVSLMTSGLASALCDLAAFLILITVVWMKIDSNKEQSQEKILVDSSEKLEIEP